MVVLSVAIDMGSWGYPIAIKIWRMVSESFACWRTLFISVSTTDVTASLRLCYSIKIALLSLYLYGLVGEFASLKYPAILLGAFVSTRYAASESTKSCMSLA